MGIYHAEEWQDACGRWHCNDTNNLVNNSSAWYHPVRILNMTPANFIRWLKNTYNPNIYHNESCTFVYWDWDSQKTMREYKNFINKKAREVGYIV